MSADFKQSEPEASDSVISRKWAALDPPNDYPFWAGALSAALDAALNPTSATDRDVALECLTDYRAWRDAKAKALRRG